MQLGGGCLVLCLLMGLIGAKFRRGLVVGFGQ